MKASERKLAISQQRDSLAETIFRETTYLPQLFQDQLQKVTSIHFFAVFPSKNAVKKAPSDRIGCMYGVQDIQRFLLIKGH